MTPFPYPLALMHHRQISNLDERSSQRPDGTRAPLTDKWSGKYPFAQKDGVVPGSDGAGEVVAVGPKVTRFEVGAKVVTLFNQGHIGGSLDGRKLSPFILNGTHSSPQILFLDLGQY